MRRLALLGFVATFAAGSPGSAQVLNEIVVNHTGTDTHAFVELAGTASTSYSTLRILEVEGDSDSPGTVDRVVTPGTTDAAGIWATTVPTTAGGANDFENGTVTALLVSGWSGSVGLDLDTNNDGTLDATPWTTLLDAVAIHDGGASDRTYSGGVVLASGFDGDSFVPGGLSRIPSGVDTNTTDDWARNDFDGAGFSGFVGTPDPGEALNTPGAVNQAVGGGGADLDPVLNELIVEHVGADSAEMVEVWGQISTSYATAAVVVLDGEGDPGEALHVWTVGTTNGAGLWRTPALGTDAIDPTSLTVLLVEGWTGALGQDLDSNDDGTLDTTPWTAIYDSVAIDDGAGADLFYSPVVLAPGFGGEASAVGGASRLPQGADTDAGADWVRNDFDGEGLAGFPDGTLGAGEARNTPAATNRRRLADVWSGIVASTPEELRAAVHERIADHQRFAYSSGDADTWEILELADENPADPSEIVDVYLNEDYVKFGGGTGPYNREHTWAQSWGFPVDALDNYPRSDTHHLFLSEVDYNADRGRRPFANCSAACTRLGTVANNGVGGVSGAYPSDSNWVTGPDDQSGIFEVWDHRKGDVARAILYLDVRYEGGVHAATGYAEPDLVATDDLGLIAASATGSNELLAHMGRLSALLAWHAADPPDAGDVARNDVVWRYQGNRNPFVDHPEWVACIWAGDCGALFVDGFEAGDTSAWSSAVP